MSPRRSEDQTQSSDGQGLNNISKGQESLKSSMATNASPHKVRGGAKKRMGGGRTTRSNRRPKSDRTAPSSELPSETTLDLRSDKSSIEVPPPLPSSVAAVKTKSHEQSRLSVDTVVANQGVAPFEAKLTKTKETAGGADTVPNRTGLALLEDAMANKAAVPSTHADARAVPSLVAPASPPSGYHHGGAPLGPSMSHGAAIDPVVLDYAVRKVLTQQFGVNSLSQLPSAAAQTLLDGPLPQLIANYLHSSESPNSSARMEMPPAPMSASPLLPASPAPFPADALPSEIQIEQNTNLYLNGLGDYITDDELLRIGSVYGEVISHKAIINSETGLCKGYGFIMYAWAKDAAVAMVELQKKGYQTSFARHESFSAKLRMMADVRSTNVYVSNLPLTMTDQQLEQLVAPNVIVSRRILCKADGTSRGVGFIRFHSRDIAQDCIDRLHGKRLAGHPHPLQARFADSESQKRLKQDTTLRKVYADLDMGVLGIGSPQTGRHRGSLARPGAANMSLGRSDPGPFNRMSLSPGPGAIGSGMPSSIMGSAASNAGASSAALTPTSSWAGFYPGPLAPAPATTSNSPRPMWNNNGSRNNHNNLWMSANTPGSTQERIFSHSGLGHELRNPLLDVSSRMYAPPSEALPHMPSGEPASHGYPAPNGVGTHQAFFAPQGNGGSNGHSMTSSSLSPSNSLSTTTTTTTNLSYSPDPSSATGTTFDMSNRAFLANMGAVHHEGGGAGLPVSWSDPSLSVAASDLDRQLKSHLHRLSVDATKPPVNGGPVEQAASAAQLQNGSHLFPPSPAFSNLAAAGGFRLQQHNRHLHHPGAPSPLGLPDSLPPNLAEHLGSFMGLDAPRRETVDNNEAGAFPAQFNSNPLHLSDFVRPAGKAAIPIINPATGRAAINPTPTIGGGSNDAFAPAMQGPDLAGQASIWSSAISVPSKGNQNNKQHSRERSDASPSSNSRGGSDLSEHGDRDRPPVTMSGTSSMPLGLSSYGGSSLIEDDRAETSI